MHIKDQFLLREIAGEYVIIPTGDTFLRFNGMMAMNEVGVFMWNCLQKDHTEESLLQAVLDEYDVDEETAIADVKLFVDTLMSHGILE